MATALKMFDHIINPHILARAQLLSITVSIERITPEVAASYLKVNRGNRKLQDGRAREYAATMRRGAWWLNGETIVFADDESLMNGQHRLRAVILSGVPIEVLVVRNVPRAAFSTQDQGKTRSAADIVGILGEKNQNVLAGALRVVLMMSEHQRVIGSAASDQIIGGVEKFGGVRDWIHPAEIARSFAPHSLMTGLYYLFEQASCDTQAVAMFAKQLGTGTDLSSDSPVFALRKRLLDLKIRKAKVGRNELAAMIITAWNAYIEGRSLRMIKSDYAKYGMPKISG